MTRRRLFAQYWPVWLALLFVTVLPVNRLMEFPLSIFALSLGFLALFARRRIAIRQAARFIIPLFLCIWIPMVLSSIDSMDPGKSWAQTVGALRFPAAALAIAILLRQDGSRELFLRLMTWLLLFSAADGYIQLVFGRDLFGVTMNEDRLNAMFYDHYQFYGPTLAMLSPLGLDYMRRHWSTAWWAFGFAFILGAVLISGVRAAWVMMLVVMAAFMVPMLRDQVSRTRALMLPVTAVVTLGLMVLASPLLQERLQLSSLATLGTEEALDEATSYRVPIFRHALAMYRDHPVNGIGVRAMRAAYPGYADPDDPHILANPEKPRAHHAHNIVLEFMADTGTIGLAGLVTALVLAWRHWRSMSGRQRESAFPYVVALLAIVFPVNSYFAIFGVYMTSIIWVLVGLWAAAGLSESPGESGQPGSGEPNQAA